MIQTSSPYEQPDTEAQEFDPSMDLSAIHAATINLGSSERVKFWGTFQPTADIPCPSRATGREIDDISAVFAGSKPATILLSEDLFDPLVEKLVNEEPDRYESLHSARTIDYYGRFIWFWGKEENVKTLAELYKGRGGDDSPLPADESFHRAVGEALGYPAEAINAFIEGISGSKLHSQQKGRFSRVLGSMGLRR